MKEQKIEKSVALITGASSGIGYELAKLFAEDGYTLILVARNKIRLDIFAEELRQQHGIKVEVIEKDLSLEDASIEIYNEIQALNISINVLVNNAGAGSCGLFHEIEYKKALDMIKLNITSLTLLTRLFLIDMIRKGNGKILNVASTGAYQPGPYTAVYYATKAYVLSLSEALTNELKDYGISVTTLCPGATRTEFAERAGKAGLKSAMEAKDVARIAYKGLNKNRKVVIPGLQNKMAIVMSKVLPGSITADIVRKIQQKLTNKHNES